MVDYVIQEDPRDPSVGNREFLAGGHFVYINMRTTIDTQNPVAFKQLEDRFDGGGGGAALGSRR